MNADLGEIFKNLFSKSAAAKGGKGSGKGKPANPFVKVVVAGGVALLLIVLYLFLVYFPTQEENRIKEQKILQINNLNSCLTELSDRIIIASKELSTAQSGYKKLTNLFHNGQELDDLYRHISLLALTNQLIVLKINKIGESPVFESKTNSADGAISNSAGFKNTDGSMSICDKIQSDKISTNNFQDQSSGNQANNGQTPKSQKVAYYEFKVEFEISGDYASYTKFRKGLAELKKIININQEKITVIQSKTKKGQVKVRTVLAIYRLPANKSEKYIQNTQE